MKIYEHFMEILDLGNDIIIKEANHKFSDTVMRVNDTLQWVSGITINTINLCEDPNRGEYIRVGGVKIKSIKPWIPLTGVYSYHDKPIFLRKIAKRQWKKSFCWNQYEVPTRTKFYDLFALDGQEPMHCYMDRKSKLMFYQNHKIGYHDGGEWKIDDKIFEIEFNKLVEKEKEYGDPVDVRRYVYIS